jgi:hypothetical protein
MSFKLLICLLLTTAGAAVAQASGNEFFNSKHAYLDQAPPSDDPKVFAPEFLKDGQLFPMGRVAISNDGRDFYFGQGDSWNSGEHARVMVISFSNSRWQAPRALAAQFLDPTFSPDGETLFLRKIVQGGSMKNVWRCTRNNGAWGTPTPYLEEKFGLYNYMLTRSGNAYVGSDATADDVKNGITYAYSLLTISEGAPKVHSLGRPLNEPGFNGGFYIGPDESYMIVSAKETKTYESELYISFRKKDLTWTEPVSLGSRINNGLAHRWGQYVSPDGKYLFYTQGTSEKDCAIYWVRFDGLLDGLRPKNL